MVYFQNNYSDNLSIWYNTYESDKETLIQTGYLELTKGSTSGTESTYNGSYTPEYIVVIGYDSIDYVYFSVLDIGTMSETDQDGLTIILNNKSTSNIYTKTSSNSVSLDYLDNKANRYISNTCSSLNSCETGYIRFGYYQYNVPSCLCVSKKISVPKNNDTNYTILIICIAIFLFIIIIFAILIVFFVKRNK